MHRSIQFFPFVLFLTSFIIVVLTILSPTAIFKEQVSLFKLSGNVTITNIHSNSKAGADSLNLATIFVIPGGKTQQKRGDLSTMVKRTRKQDTRATNSLNSDSSSSSIVSTSLYIGLMGACFRIPSSLNGSIASLNCTTASITPMFTPLFETLSLPTVLQTALPNQFPLAPAVVSLSAILLLITSLIHLIVVIMPITNKTRAEQQVSLRKNGTILGSISLLFGLAGSLALRVELGRFSTAFNTAATKLGGDLMFSQASLGTGFIQLWAAWSIQLVGLVSMTFLK